jgi:glycosidase
MSRYTEKDLRNLLIYQVYVRNHSEEGTFKALEKDLDRIKNLGVDVVYLLPIHEIGQIKRKGTLGSPYSIKDYRSINHELGTLDDFQDLIKAVHDKDMKLMIDVVYNHTSYDSVLLQEHPEYFFKNEAGEFANRVGDWWDITDLDYTVDIALWEELIDTLVYWTKMGVDGFRWDVASLLPLEFIEEAHERVLDENPHSIFLSESVHGGFLRYIRNQGYKALSESEIFQVFDMAYDYDVHPYFEQYLKGEAPFKRYVEELLRQDEIYADNYVKMRNLENHDFGRFAPMVKNDINKINNWTSLVFFLKGSTMIYAGQEFCEQRQPSLFEKETVQFDGENISPLVTKLASITKDKAFSYGFYNIHITDKDVFYGEYKYLGKVIVGLFNVGLEEATLDVSIKDGVYTNKITGNKVTVEGGKLELSKEPVIIEYEED